MTPPSKQTGHNKLSLDVMSQTKLEQPNHVVDTIEVTQLKLPSCRGFKYLFEKKACISITQEKEYNRKLKLTDHPRPE